MEIKKLNSLVELYFEKLNELDKDKPFLEWLKLNKTTYTWSQVSERIKHLSPSFIIDLILLVSLKILSEI